MSNSTEIAVLSDMVDQLRKDLQAERVDHEQTSDKLALAEIAAAEASDGMNRWAKISDGHLLRLNELLDEAQAVADEIASRESPYLDSWASRLHRAIAACRQVKHD